MSARPGGSFGVDTPWVPWLWVGFAGISLAFGLWLLSSGIGGWAAWIGPLLLVLAAGYLVGAALYWHASLRGKFDVWDRLLRGLDVPPDPRALDIGCGRGAVAIMIARRFPEAVVRGIDLWRVGDQSGNSLEAAARNADANGLGARVEFDTGDMTRVPYADGTFDLVTASLSIHNVPTEDGRAAAVAEAARVLAPGGTACIVDIRHTREYAAELGRLGLDVHGPRGLGWRAWWTGPWTAASVVEGRKPPEPA